MNTTNNSKIPEELAGTIADELEAMDAPTHVIAVHRGRGRPPVPDSEKLSAQLVVRMTPADRQRLNAAARAAGMRPTAWARDELVRALEA